MVFTNKGDEWGTLGHPTNCFCVTRRSIYIYITNVELMAKSNRIKRLTRWKKDNWAHYSCSVSSALLGDDFLQFFWLDPFSSGPPTVHLPLQEWPVNRWTPTISRRKCADELWTKATPSPFVLMNCWLAHTFLTSLQVQINVLIVWS